MMPTTRSALLLLGALLALVPGVASAQISITRNADLNFGSLTVGGTAGTVVITPAGTRSTTGSVVGIGAAFGAASFTVSITSGGATYLLFLPGNTTLTGPGANTMTANTFTSNPSGLIQSVPSVPGSETVTVGARLNVGANQAAGTYSGTFTVTVFHF